MRHPSLVAVLTAVVALDALALAPGCAGPPIPAPIEDLPVCPNFISGKTEMEGSLKLPVRLRVLDGKTQLYQTTITGHLREDGTQLRSFIVDDNAKYRVEWAQCSNERAPRPLAEVRARSKASAKAREHQQQRDEESGAYECGEAKVYKGDAVLETKKGDRQSHVIHYVPPPDPSCWQSDAPSRDPKTATVEDAGATAAPAPSDDAGAAASADAGASDAGAPK